MSIALASSLNHFLINLHKSYGAAATQGWREKCDLNTQNVKWAELRIF